MNVSVRISLGGSTYRFLRVKQAGDWSLIVVFDRDSPNPDQRTVFTSRGPSPRTGPSVTDNKRVTYHTTGQVNYHGLISTAGPSYFQPLPDLDRPNMFVGLSVPDGRRLTPLKAANPDDLIVPLPEEMAGQRFTLALVVLPPDDAAVGCPVSFRIDYDIFSVVGLWSPPPAIVPGFEEHFLYFAPEAPYKERQLPIPQATLAYHQRKTGGGLGVYPPDGEGVYTLFTSLEMRNVPTVTITFKDPRYRIQILSERATAHRIPFRILEGDRLVRRNDLRSLIASIELDAEL